MENNWDKIGLIGTEKGFNLERKDKKKLNHLITNK